MDKDSSSKDCMRQLILNELGYLKSLNLMSRDVLLQNLGIDLNDLSLFNDAMQDLISDGTIRMITCYRLTDCNDI